jgi:hypothetical protein
MKNILNLIPAVFFLTSMVFKLNAQSPATNSDGQVVTVQPKIVVIPYTKEGEDLRTILEEDVSRRVAITKIKEAFDGRGFTTVDFIAKLKAAKDNNVFTSDNQTDIKSQIIQLSGADIYVQAEVSVQKSESGTAVTLILTGYDISTGNSLANKVGESGRFYTDDIGKLASKAVDKIADDFLNTLQSKFTDIVNNGRSVIVDISFDQGSTYTMASEIGSSGLPLSDQIEEWMGKNAYKNNYHIQGTTGLKMIFDDVHIPLKDQSSGTNYSPNKFALEIFKYLKSLSLEPKKEVKGSTIYITIK